MILTKIISGGQIGADLAGLIAARRAGIATGGVAPQGWLIEVCYPSGTAHVAAPWLADYGLVECVAEGYAARRKWNVELCDAALLFGDNQSRGSKGLIRDCETARKPLVYVEAGCVTPGMVASAIDRYGYRTVLVAGNRESVSPGIGKRVERFLNIVFRLLRATPPAD